MDVPEKIYINPSNLLAYNGYYAFTTKNDDNSVEYTRTDAFLVKAEKFFEDNLTEEDCKFGSSEWTEVKTDYKSIDSFIRAFRYYMKKNRYDKV